MTPRPKRRSKGLPDNLDFQVKGGRKYYRYWHRVERKYKGVGSDKPTAVRRAKIWNRELDAKLHVDDFAFVEQQERGTENVVLRDFIARFDLDAVRSRKGKPLAEATKREFTRMFKVISDSELGTKFCDRVTRRDIVQFLAQFPATASNRYRTRLRRLFVYIIADGLAEENPVDKTLAQPEEVQRERLALKDFQLIHAAGEPWSKNIMTLGRITLQRRTDLTLMRFEHFDGTGLDVTQQKTGRRIRIELPTVPDLVHMCRDDTASPFLIHRRPIRRVRAAWKVHWTQVAPDMVTREFAEIRDRLGICSELEPVQRPSFHEIRALGADLYRQAGYPEEWIQSLLGHEDREMTAKYLAGHGHIEVITVPNLEKV